ncbi:MAG: UDP-glucose/GDP-mannose dehydrogenase family protein [Candidatus Krumholzibacteriota bacterium]|nr:UDP-glucose/GDP-mannose dehydrogenase family protein [Candidatus Krumholzibacteriota bacterium]
MVGTGYVGLVSGACLADFGNTVICVDIDSERIENIKKGIMPIYEPGLKELVKRNYDAGRLRFTTDLSSSVKKSLVVFSAVGTPMDDDGSADLSAVYSVSRDVARNIDGYRIFVQKSTVPVGTSEEVGRIIKENLNGDIPFDLVSNPEFLREGSAIEDFMRPNRVVIGVNSDRAREIMRDIYRPLYLLETPIVFTSIRTAELVKYASNAFLAVKISFINEISDLCEKVDADVNEVARAIGLDKRIGPKFLHAGAGYGGSCLPKDVSAILHTADNSGVELKVIRAASDVNEERIDMILGKLGAEIDELKGKKITLLGLSFKPNTDDLRHAPSLKLVDRLRELGAVINAYDPIAMDNARKEYSGKIEFFSDEYSAMDGADALVLMTEWNEFRQLDFDRVKELLVEPVIVDCRNIYKPAVLKAMGFRYQSFGRPEDTVEQEM